MINISIKKNNFISLSVSLCGTVSLGLLYGKYHLTDTYDFIYVALFLINFFTVRRNLPIIYSDKKATAGMCIWSFLLSAFTVLGFLTKRGNYEYLLASDILMILAACVPFSVGSAYTVASALNRGLSCVFKPFVCKKLSFEKGDSKRLLIYALILFLLWLPVLLAYYPGLFCYDVKFQMEQFLEHSFNTHHPILHTLILGYFYSVGKSLGSYNLGLLLYTLFQMSVMALSLGCMFLYMYRCSVSNKAIACILAFFGLCPFFPVLVISATKDILFSACLIMLCVFYGYIFECEDKKMLRRYSRGAVIVSVLMYLFRNNGKYALIITVIFALITVRKKHSRRILLLSSSSLLLSLTILSGLSALTNASEGSINEALSVPYQQLSRVGNFRFFELSDEEEIELHTLIPNLGGYERSLADDTKRTGLAPEYPSLFSRLYLRYLFRYPYDYILAFLYNTEGYWNLSDVTHSNIYNIQDPQAHNAYLQTYTIDGFGITHSTKFPALENIYEKLFIENKYQDIPVLSFLFAPALYTWFIFLLVFLALSKKLPCDAYFPFVIILAYMATVALGPCCLIRYVFPYVYSIPLLCCIVYRGNFAKRFC